MQPFSLSLSFTMRGYFYKYNPFRQFVSCVCLHAFNCCIKRGGNDVLHLHGLISHELISFFYPAAGLYKDFCYRAGDDGPYLIWIWGLPRFPFQEFLGVQRLVFAAAFMYLNLVCKEIGSLDISTASPKSALMCCMFVSSINIFSFWVKMVECHVSWQVS